MRDAARFDASELMRQQLCSCRRCALRPLRPGRAEVGPRLVGICLSFLVGDTSKVHRYGRGAASVLRVSA
eukprot:2550805-Pleurochrysis_carterae.AAC.1